MAQHQDLKRKGGADPDHQMSTTQAPPPPLSIEVPKRRDLPNKSNPWSDVQLPVDILLLTVEDCEFLACYAFLENSFKSYDRTLGYVYFGTMGGSGEEALKVALMRCHEGCSVPCGSLVTVMNAVWELRPKAAFLVGSCQGINPEHTKLGDVVVSSKLSTEQFTIPVGKQFINKLNLSSADGWNPPLKDPVSEKTVQVHCDSVILCGSQLFITKQRRMSQSRVIAVERGGVQGLFAAAHDMNIEWVIVKGISHFSDDSNTSDESWKSFASIMAASVVCNMLNNAVVFKEWPHYEGLTAMNQPETTLKPEKQIPDPSPSYVVARGPRAVEAFIQAKKAGKILDKRVKVLVIGQDRVGKTSVVRSLKGEPFRDNEASTDGVKMHEALENPGSKPWKDSTMQKETTAYHYKCAECICKELQSEPQARNSTPEINLDEIHVPRPDTFKDEPTIHQSSDLSPDTNQEELPSPDNVEEDISASSSTDNNQNSSDDPLQVDDKVANIAAEKLDKNVSKASDGIWPVIWDFAGQAVFRAIHPIFMSSEALYVLVCNPTKDFLDTARCMINEDGGEEFEILAADSGDTNLDHILRWMDMVHLLRPFEDSSKIPPVVLVGTHADKSDADKKMSVLKNNLLTSFQVFFKRIAKILTIDNTLSGTLSIGEDEYKHVVNLRKEILSLAENMPHTKTEVPLTWLEVENKVCEHIRESPEKYMTKTNFRAKLIHQFYKPDLEDDLEHILNFMHDRGTIVYHGHPENPDDLVVLDPLWLISEVLCKIITAREQKGDEPDILIHRKDLRDKGLLSAVLVHHACQNLKLDDIEENIILIMKKFNLLCEFGLDKTGQPVYLVPCMLTRKPTENLMGPVFQGCEPVFITFDTNYVPFGLFSRILVRFGEWAASRTNCERPQLFANSARFVIAECVCLGFVCYKTVIKVHIWAMDDSNPVEREPEVLSEVSRCLRISLERLKQECHWLRRVSWKLCGQCKLCKGNRNGECLWHQQRECVHEDCSHYVSIDAKFFCCQHAEGSDLRVPRTWIQAVQRVMDTRGQSWKCIRPSYRPGTKYVYNMTSPRRGITLIVNNTSFASHPEHGRQLPRDGSEKDVCQVTKLFTALGFEVRTKQNLTRDDLVEVLDKVVVEDHSGYDCFVLWLMSHGKSGEVFCHDGVTIPIQTVHNMISNCRTLSCKPKVVFIQACRGEGEDEGVSIAEETKQTEFSQSQLDSPNVPVKQSSCKEPTHADFLYAFATVDEYVAYRNKDSGSYFVHGLVEAFEERGFCDHLVEILTVVKQKVSYMEINRPSEVNETKTKICKQMPESKDTFRKKLFF